MQEGGDRDRAAMEAGMVFRVPDRQKKLLPFLRMWHPKRERRFFPQSSAVEILCAEFRHGLHKLEKIN